MPLAEITHSNPPPTAATTAPTLGSLSLQRECRTETAECDCVYVSR